MASQPTWLELGNPRERVAGDESGTVSRTQTTQLGFGSVFDGKLFQGFEQIIDRNCCSERAALAVTQTTG